MKKLLLILLLCSGCYGTYYTTDVNRKVYYPKTTYYGPYVYKPSVAEVNYYKPYVYKPTTTVVVKPNKTNNPKKPSKTYKPYKKPYYKKK